jgi:hypothetical protein
LEEPLVVALQFVVEDHAADPATILADPFGTQERAVICAPCDNSRGFHGTRAHAAVGGAAQSA